MKVEDVRPEQPITLDAARPQIVRFLTYSEVKDLLDNLRKGEKVTMLIKTPPGAERREPDSAPTAPGAQPAPVPAPAPMQPAPSSPIKTAPKT
jgi:peptidyl-prolyl cis-trans isomerase C